MIKEGDEWKFYGSQQDFKINWSHVATRQYPDESKFLILGGAFSDCSDNRIEVDSFTVTGPPGTFTDLDLTPEWDDLSPDEYFMKADIADATDGFYTHTVGDVDGNIHQYTDYLEKYPFLDIPTLVSATVDDTGPEIDVLLDWEPVAGTHGYMVNLVELDASDNWVSQSSQFINPWDPTECTFTALTAGTDYQWRVRPRNFDNYEDWDNETRSDWEYFSTP
jgi:hypothetical protein